ncbi:MAG: hypothetical protein H6868_08205 [Rhodospirillales bacterium]|nr:hypothetical protein [Rhodospirillales bacterium]
MIMHVRKLLLSSVVCGSVLWGAGAVSLQAAQASTTYKPNSNWAVSKISAQQAGGDAYCAMARRFNDGLVLTLARNSEDESSLALDFQQMKLNTTQTYKVSADAGFNQVRNFDVRPVSGKAVVIHLGKDYAFYDALNRSDRLKVNMNGDVYEFFMDDIAAGQKQLNGCLATLIAPAAGEGTPQVVKAQPQARSAPVSVSSAPTPMPGERIETRAMPVPAVNAYDTARLSELMAENESLKAALAKERQNYENTFAKRGAESSAVAELQEKVSVLETENNSLQMKLADMRVVSQKQAVSAAANEAQEKLALEINSLRSANDRLLADLQAQRQVTAQLESKVAQAAGQSAAQEAAAVNTLNDRIAVLETENGRLKQDYQAQAQRMAQLETQLAQAGDKSAELARIAELEEKNKAFTADIAQKQQALSQMKEQLAQAGDKSAEQSQIASLAKENERLLGELAHQRQSMDQMKTQLAQEAGERSQETAAVNTLNDQIAVLETENGRLKHDYEAQTQRISQLETQLAQGADKSAELARIAELEEKNKVFVDEMAKKQAALSQLQAQLAQAGDRSAEQTQIASLTEENQKLLEEVEQQRQATDQIKTQLARVASEKAAESADAGAVEERIAVLETENSRLMKSLDSQNMAMASLKEKLAQASQQVAVATTDDEAFNAMQETVAALKTENAKLHEDYNRQLQELAALKTNMSDSAAAPRAEDMDRVAVLERENARLLADIEDQRTVISRLVAQQAPSAGGDDVVDDGRVAELEGQIQALKSANTALNNHLEDQKQEIAALKAAPAQVVAGDGNAAANERVAALVEQIDALTAKNADLSERLAAVSADKAAVIDKQAPYDSLAQLKTLEEELHIVTVERDRLAAELDSVYDGKAGELFEVSSSNWNLEEATRRFNEAEREIRRMGGQMEEERLRCENEKRDIELLLFDPEIASEAQISKLKTLEGELAQTKMQLAESQKAGAPDNSFELAALQDKIESLEAENARLQREGRQVETQVAVSREPLPAPTRSETVAVKDAVGDYVYDTAREMEESEAMALSAIESSAGTVSPRIDDNSSSAIYAATTVSAPAPAPEKMPQAGAQAIKAAGDDIKALLNSAQIALSGPMQELVAKDDPSVVVYSWDTPDLFGSAEQKLLADAGQFDSYVKSYLDKTASRCAGEFAAVPAVTKNQGNIRVSAYEIACIGNQGEAVASLVFYNQDDVFTTIAHEAGISGIDSAMDVRDRLVDALTTLR